MMNTKQVNKFTQSIYYCLLQSFFAVWAIMRAGNLSTRNILTPILFVLVSCFFLYSMKYIDNPKRTGRIVYVLSVIFTLLYLLAAEDNLTASLNSRLFQFCILLVCSIGLYLLFYHSLSLLFFYAGKYTMTKEEKPIKYFPLIAFFFCLICWLPYYLYEYPGIMTPDSINQFEQVRGMVPYSNHHPWMHTLLIGFFYSTGRLFTDNINMALSFFTVFQMCFMAFSVSFLIASLRKMQIKNIFCILILAFYALVPYHAVFAVTIWKDVLFSASVLLFTSALLNLLFLFPFEKRLENLSVYILYLLSGLMLCLFRTNGWYAFLVSFPFLLYAFRHRLKVMLPIHLAILAIALLLKGPVMTAYNVTQPDFVESVCIPLQQIARVISEDKKLTEAEWTSVHNVMDTTYIKELYSPGFADNMKELVRAGNPEYLASHKGEYLKLWLSLGFRYPITYLQAYIDQTSGYWYPDVPYTVAEIDGIIANETGTAHAPLIGGPIVVKTKEILLKLGDMIPLYGLLFSMGAMFWVLLILMGIVLGKKQYNRLILFFPGFAVILTLFAAAPVSSEFRYAYSLAYTLPLYLLIPFLPAKLDRC